ncbi:MAG: hypothetical protein GQ570_05195 [Helicobacteraceae bacterium]|nr:hypothetical protein [Helicobacteraceae bacterium]
MTYELYKILERPEASKFGALVQKIILINILINIFVVLITESFTLTNNILNIFILVENFTVLIFMVELFTRYIVIGYNEQYKGLKGRIKFTFTFYTIIDILSIIPYFIVGTSSGTLLLRIVRFLRFLRILKLVRMKKVLEKFFNLGSFATSNIFTQIMILFVLGIVFIFIFGFAYKSQDTSIMIFLEPSAIAESDNSSELLFGILELLIGLLIGGAFISIITEALVNITQTVKNGYYPFKGTGHILIINQNIKLKYILEEINSYYLSAEQMQDVVIFLPFVKDIDSIKQNIKSYSNLDIKLISGDILNFNSYTRVNINGAKKVLILKNNDTDTQNLNAKTSRYILTNNNFNNPDLEFIIEAQEGKNIKYIYEQIFSDVDNKYTLVEHNIIIQKFLNRSIIEPNYFKIYSSILSFNGYGLYKIQANKIYKDSLSFKEAYMQLNNGILIGIRKKKKLLLNPDDNTIIYPEDTLVVILKNEVTYTIDNNQIDLNISVDIEKLYLQTSRNVCIVGNYDTINKKSITHFLDKKSSQNLDTIVLKNNEYMDIAIWDKIIEKNYDTIILNLEDNDEFLLTMYLRNIYKDNQSFLNSIVNIIHDPTIYKLLENKNNYDNIILSEKLVSVYMSVVMFNKDVVDIFDELSESKGNEFYLLESNKYKTLIGLEKQKIKYALKQNNMIFIGTIEDKKFIINSKTVKENSKIVVLALGVTE